MEFPWDEVLFEQCLGSRLDSSRDYLLRRSVLLAVGSVLRGEVVKVMFERYLLWLGRCYLCGTIIDELDVAVQEQGTFSHRRARRYWPYRVNLDGKQTEQ